jgi:WD40 repeat protein
MLRDHKVMYGCDNNIKVLECKDNFKCIQVIKQHSDSVSSLLILPNGNIVSGTGKGTIMVLDTNDHYKCISTLPGHVGAFSSILLTGLYMVSAGIDLIKIWDFEKGQCFETLNSPTNCLLALSDEEFAVVGSEANEIVIWRFC